MTNTPPIATAVVGSYPQPDWLVDRENLDARTPPRIRARDIWRIPEPFLQQAQDDATRLAIADMEHAGVDILSDGEIRRESYSNRFATALEGMDIERPGQVMGRMGKPTYVPRVVSDIRRPQPILARDMTLLRSATTHTTKITVPGPFTLSMQAQNEHYPDDESLAMALAEVVNAEVKDLFAAGADIVQLDEPWLQARPEQAKRFGVASINRAFEGVSGTTALHLCFGYAQTVTDKPSGYSFLPELDASVVDIVSIEAAQPHLDLSVLKTLPSKRIMLGVISMAQPRAEDPAQVSNRLREALRYISRERLIAAPDCGMKYLTRESALAKLQAMVAGARQV